MQIDKTSFQHRWKTYSHTFPVIGGILALLVYLGSAWLLLPPQAVWSPDEGAKLLQLQNLRLEDRRLVYDILYIGRELDPDLQFVQPNLSRGLIRIVNGALYFCRLPVFTLLTLPFFQWLGLYGLYLLPAIGGAMTGVLALYLLERNDRRVVMWILIAFGSPIFIYSTIFWEHTLATSLGIGGAWLALQASSMARSTWHKLAGWGAAGGVLGISVYLRLELAIFALALLLACWLVGHSCRWGPLWAGWILGLTLLPYIPLHQAMFGQAVPDNARYLFYPLRYLIKAQWNAVPDLLIGPFAEEAINPGWLGVLWAIATILAIAHSFGATDSVAARNVRLTGLGISAIIAAIFLFTGTFYRSAHGLLFTTPWAVLGVCRARQVWQRGDWRMRIIVLTTLLGLIGYTIGIAGLRAASPQGGLEWGNRFAMVFYPFLAMIALWDLKIDRFDTRTLVIIGALVLLGVGFQVRGLFVIRHDKQISAALNQVLYESPEPAIVSDLWWMPFNAAPIYPHKAIYVAPTPAAVKGWVELVGSRKIKQFCLVTLNENLLNDTARILDVYRLDVVEMYRIENVLVLRVVIRNHPKIPR